MKPKTAWLPALRKLLGGKKVSAEADVLAAHASDAWLATHLPDAVVFARSTEDVSKLLRFASRRCIPVTARGSGRGFVGGCVPAKGGIVLSLARMNQIKEISVEDGVAVVQPGVITARLQEEARKRGLFYPPDPASLKESSIGGNIATNAGGPRCLKYGVTRNYVLGLEVVLANGEIVRLGGRTIKNKAGFDLVSLFVGSEGMLGIVTEATLRLLPHPPARAALAATFRNATDAARAVLAVQQAGLLPSAMEVADAFTLQSARAYGCDIPSGDALLLLEMDGQPQAIRAERNAAARALEQCHALKIIPAEGHQQCERLWNMRRAFSESLKATGLKKLNEDVVVPRGKLTALFAWAEKARKQTGIPIACFGHAGDGNIHVNIMVSREDKKSLRLQDELFRRVIAWNGAITGEHGIGLAKKRWWPQAASPSLRRLHQKMKKALDPLDILNPGKFLSLS
ncbi:MAG: FAD-linked oxidase C-terminal domain-containing protein [bacterium]